VLHRFDAESSFISAEFDHHFLLMVAASRATAMPVYLAFGFWFSSNSASPEAMQAAAHSATFQSRISAKLPWALVTALVAALMVASSCMTVIPYLGDFDMRRAPGGYFGNEQGNGTFEFQPFI
jgi:cell division protein FtsX